MIYPNITSLVPESEYFDSSAIVNEGVYLSIGHVNAIENQLGIAAAAQQDLASQIESLNAQLAESAQQLQDAQAQLGHRDAEVQTLNGQVDELKKKAAGNFTQTTKDQDEESVNPKDKWLTSYDLEARKYAGIK